MTKRILLAFFLLFCLGRIEITDSIKAKDIKLSQDIKCLAVNIYHEARGESIEGKNAVAQVVLNRTNDNRFPDNVCEVVYQKRGKIHQFSWTKNLDAKITDSKMWNESLEIARNALINQIAHTGIKDSNALYYHANYVHPKWHKNNLVASIGKHLFYSEI